jgi:hypothetical protein
MNFRARSCVGFLAAVVCAESILGFQLSPSSSIAWIPKYSGSLKSELYCRSNTIRNVASSSFSVGQSLRTAAAKTPSSRDRATRIVPSASARDVWSVTGVGITTVNQPFGGEPGADVTTWRHDEFGTGIELWQV